MLLQCLLCVCTIFSLMLMLQILSYVLSSLHMQHWQLWSTKICQSSYIEKKYALIFYGINDILM